MSKMTKTIHHLQSFVATYSELAVLGLGPEQRLTCEEIERFVTDPTARSEFTPEARRAMRKSTRVLAKARADGQEIYGLTTGFGPHVKYAASTCADTQGAGLIAHLGAGFGSPASPEVVLATMLIRARTLAEGMSGIELEVADALMGLINARVIPVVPEIGSVGASGDLIPLSFIARVLMGEGEAVVAGQRLSGADALRVAGLKKLNLSGRDALALVNGTAFMTAFSALALARAERLVLHAERLTGWVYRVLGCRAQALDARLHKARGHPGQMTSAANILQEASRFGTWEDVSRPLQEVYSLRCAPQILGACRDQLAHARNMIERELNGVNDNPVVWSGDAQDLDQAVLHGGNFQGQQVAFASDAINTALVQTAVLAERQIDVLVNPEFNGAAPLLLAWQPGATSGMAGAQLTATALVAEMRHHSMPVAISSIPTNGRNQDVVSMGTLASRAALGQTDRVAGVLAILGMCADQLTSLRSKGRASGRTTPRPDWFGAFEAFEADRPLFADIHRLSESLIKVA